MRERQVSAEKAVRELAEKAVVAAVVYNVALVLTVLGIGGGLAPGRTSVIGSVAVALVIPVLLLWKAPVVWVDRLLTPTIWTAEGVEREIGLPVLAVIGDINLASKLYGYSADSGHGASAEAAPVAKGRSRRISEEAAAPIELVPHELPRTQIAESYRSLRTAVLLSSARELKVLAMTSAVAGEGKTATAANLAIVLAQLGRPVLIVDADLRKPRLHQVFRVSNQTGLVSVLTSGVNADDAVVATAVPNLWIGPSGPLSPNPPELLSSDRMREWLRAVRLRFEYIIVDTPPALAGSDASIVGVLADGVVLTLRSGEVTREEARLSRDRLRDAGVRILGVVLNRYRSPSSGYGRRYRPYEQRVADERPAERKAGSAA
jgi:capsular exopolysaccharide synthesis family protein